MHPYGIPRITRDNKLASIFFLSLVGGGQPRENSTIVSQLTTNKWNAASASRLLIENKLAQRTCGPLAIQDKTSQNHLQVYLSGIQRKPANHLKWPFVCGAQVKS